MSTQPFFGLFSLDESGKYQPAPVDKIVATARCCLDAMIVREAIFDAPQLVKDYLVVKLGRLEHEIFAVLFLDAQHRLIEFREMFRGSVSQTSVYPREVLKEALALNAAAVIFAHNHPSGHAEPSRADENLTASLKAALAMVDIRVLDHVVVAAGRSVSMAERGLL